jgi:competence protein ComEA
MPVKHKMDLNTASVEELAGMQGLGEGHARDIVQYREKNGPFKSFDDLKNVPGFDAKLIEVVRENAEIGESSPGTPS